MAGNISGGALSSHETPPFDPAFGNISGAAISTGEVLSSPSEDGNISGAGMSVSQPELKLITLNIGGAASVTVTTIGAVLKAPGLPDLTLQFDQNLIAYIGEKYGEVGDLLLDADIGGTADGEPFSVAIRDRPVILV